MSTNKGREQSASRAHFCKVREKDISRALTRCSSLSLLPPVIYPAVPAVPALPRDTALLPRAKGKIMRRGVN